MRFPRKRKGLSNGTREASVQKQKMYNTAPMQRFLRALAAGIVAAVAVLLLFWFFDYLEQLNSIAYDFTLRLAGPIQPSSPVLIVAIDEESVAREGQWPWSREKLARLVDQLGKGSPSVIALDVLLDDATNPAADTALAEAFSRSKSVVLAARIDEDKSKGVEIWRKPQPEFVLPNVRLGHAHADPDFDGITRRVYSAKYSQQAGGPPIPALSFQALRGAGVQIDPHFEEARSGAQLFRPQPMSIRFAGDPQTSFPQVPAWQVMDGAAAPGVLRDRIVLVGATAEGLGDQWWFTPFSGTKHSNQRMSGVEIHANAVETLYSHRWIREISARTLPAALNSEYDGSYAEPADYVYGFLFLVALIAAFVMLWWFERLFEDVRFYAVSFASGVAAIGVSWALMKYANTWFAFPPFLFLIVVASPAIGVLKLVRVNRDLDSKIEHLSRWGETTQFPAEWSAAERIARELLGGPDRDGWVGLLRTFEDETGRRVIHRKHLLGERWRNSRWRLGAVDFFNEELIRFLSFNSAILQSIEDVIIVSDVAGRVVYQNPAAARLENYRKDAPFAPDYFASLLDGRKFSPVFAEIFSQQKTVTMEFVAARETRRVYHVTLAPIGRIGLVLSMHDATAQYELNLAKNEMVSLVSHELRTPLTAIVGYSEMLLKYDLVQAKGQQFLGAIIDESHRLSKLIQSFLDIAYIESGRQKVSKTEFDIGPVFRDMMSVLAPVAEQKGIRVEVPVDAATRVRADRLLLYQALTNLVTNAIKYSPDGTLIRIAVSNGDGGVAFRVTDQGCGIPPEDAGRIFEKFYRRANRETQEQSGFGLGLAFVKEVAVRHSGEVTVESEVGKGSTFTLRIPN
jgi:signal transduction histidine kinase/CHASE2 domain-containing sensor protein